MKLAFLAFLFLAPPLSAQVHYSEHSPWDQRADSGPDAEVPGWFYNLGITGMRARLIAEEPKALRIEYVFPGSPAAGKVAAGDLLVGAGEQTFQTAHRNGYGMEVFGADGPVAELARALEEAQGAQGLLALTLRRGEDLVEVKLRVGTKYGSYADTYPADCAKSARILGELLPWLAAHQGEDGSFGNPVHDTFAPLGPALGAEDDGDAGGGVHPRPGAFEEGGVRWWEEVVPGQRQPGMKHLGNRRTEPTAGREPRRGESRRRGSR